MATRNYLEALLRSGARVAARPLFFSTDISECPKSIQNAEKVMLGEYDTVIIAAPAYCFEIVDATIPHLGLFFTESKPLPQGWSSHCRLMDHIIHPCSDQRAWCDAPGFPDSSVVPVPVDVNKYFKSYKKSKHLDGSRFNFYTISDMSKRKNFEGLLRAYFYGFGATEPVALTIKTSGDKSQTESFVKAVADKCNLRAVPPVNVITDRLSEEEILQLHKSGDCFVSASYGEGWNLPAQDALLFGKTPIVAAFGGQKDFVTDKNGWLVDAIEEPCFDAGKTHEELFTGKRVWGSPDLLQIAACMREAFSDKGLREEKSEAGMEAAPLFSYEKIGSDLLGVLTNAATQKKEALRPAGTAGRNQLD